MEAAVNTPQDRDSEAVRQKVREGHGKIAASGESCCGPAPTCCGSSPVASDSLAKHIGYTPEELAALPAGANMGLSCGNPNALAALEPGEVVLDLGTGGGFYVAGRTGGGSAALHLAQNPAAFVENETVKAALTEKGEAALPLVLADGQVLACGKYPERAELAGRLKLESGAGLATNSTCGCG